MQEGDHRAAIDRAMERYADGDDAAFAELYDGLAPRLFGFLLRQTRDRARAEDLLQQTLLQMHRARGTFLRGGEVTPWAFAIARRLVIDGARRGRRELLGHEPDEGADDGPPASGPSADELVQARQVQRRIDDALAELPDNQRIAFELLKRDGLSVAEAAQALGTTVSAVKLRAHRAYEALRARLGDLVAREGGGPS